MNADVAINTVFFKLNADIVSPRIAPPVPKSPAENPDKLPPNKAYRIIGFITKSL